jgi:hypothetical protein
MSDDDFGDPMLPPTHPNGPRKMRAVPVLCSSTRNSKGCGHPVDDHVGTHTPRPDCDCCSWRQNEPEPADPQLAFYGANTVNSHRRDLPKPPPADLGFDPAKWARMTRAERRAVTRYARGRR